MTEFKSYVRKHVAKHTLFWMKRVKKKYVNPLSRSRSMGFFSLWHRFNIFRKHRQNLCEIAICMKIYFLSPVEIEMVWFHFVYNVQKNFYFQIFTCRNPRVKCVFLIFRSIQFHDWTFENLATNKKKYSLKINEFTNSLTFTLTLLIDLEEMMFSSSSLWIK